MEKDNRERGELTSGPMHKDCKDGAAMNKPENPGKCRPIIISQQESGYVVTVDQDVHAFSTMGEMSTAVNNYLFNPWKRFNS